MPTRETSAIDRSRIHIATLLLLCMILVFIAARLYLPLFPWLAPLEAFAEAAVVGAVADWFAVVALFRHPLGIPIPHTAIVPAKQARIADNVAEFVSENFFAEDSRNTPAASAPSASHLIGEYLADPRQRELMAGHLCAALRIFINSPEGSSVLTPFFSRLSLNVLEKADIADFLAESLSLLLTGSQQRLAVSQVIGLLRRSIVFHRSLIEQRLVAASPWFIPEPISRPLARSVVARIERLCEEMESSEHHPARAKLRESLAELIRALRSDSKVRESLAQLKQEILADQTYQQYVHTVGMSLLNFIRQDLAQEHQSLLHLSITDGLTSFSHSLLREPHVAADCDRIVRELSREIFGARRETIRASIQRTIVAWDPETLVQKLEQQVGRDLQFIRINGTIVGGCVGLLLYYLKQSFLA